jgi:hypothetical protein
LIRDKICCLIPDQEIGRIRDIFLEDGYIYPQIPHLTGQDELEPVFSIVPPIPDRPPHFFDPTTAVDERTTTQELNFEFGRIEPPAGAGRRTDAGGVR